MDLINFYTYKRRLRIRKGVTVNIWKMFLGVSLLCCVVSSWRITQKCPHGHYYNDGCTACWCDIRTGLTRCEQLLQCSRAQIKSQVKCPSGRLYKDKCGNDCTCYESTGAVFCNEKRKCPPDLRIIPAAAVPGPAPTLPPPPQSPRLPIIVVSSTPRPVPVPVTTMQPIFKGKMDQIASASRTGAPVKRFSIAPEMEKSDRFGLPFITSTFSPFRMESSSNRNSVFNDPSMMISSTTAPLPSSPHKLHLPGRSAELIIEPAIIVRKKGSNKASVIRNPASATEVNVSSRNRNKNNNISPIILNRSDTGNHLSSYPITMQKSSSSMAPLQLYGKQLKTIMDIKRRAYQKLLGAKVNFNFEIATGKGSPSTTSAPHLNSVNSVVSSSKFNLPFNSLVVFQRKNDYINNQNTFNSHSEQQYSQQYGYSSTTEHPRRFDDNFDNSTMFFDSPSTTTARPIFPQTKPFFWRHKEHIKNTLKNLSPVPPLKQLVSYVSTSTESYLANLLNNIAVKNKMKQQLQLQQQQLQQQQQLENLQSFSTTEATPTAYPSYTSLPPINQPTFQPQMYPEQQQYPVTAFPFSTIEPYQELQNDPAMTPIHEVYQNHEMPPNYFSSRDNNFNHHSYLTNNFDSEAGGVMQTTKEDPEIANQFPYMTELMKEIARSDNLNVRPTVFTPTQSPALTAVPTFQTPGPPYAEIDVVQPLSFLPPQDPEPATPTQLLSHRTLMVGSGSGSRHSLPAFLPHPNHRARPTVRVNIDKPIYVNTLAGASATAAASAPPAPPPKSQQIPFTLYQQQQQLANYHHHHLVKPTPTMPPQPPPPPSPNRRFHTQHSIITKLHFLHFFNHANRRNYQQQQHQPHLHNYHQNNNYHSHHHQHPYQLHHSNYPHQTSSSSQFFIPKPKHYRVVLKGKIKDDAVKVDDAVPRFVSRIAHEFFKKPEIYVPKIRPGKPLTLEKVVLNHDALVPKEVTWSTTPGTPTTKLHFTQEAHWKMREELSNHGIMFNTPIPPVNYGNDPNVYEMDAPVSAVKTWETHTGVDMGTYTPGYSSSSGDVITKPNQGFSSSSLPSSPPYNYPSISSYSSTTTPQPPTLSPLSIDQQIQQDLQHQILLSQQKQHQQHQYQQQQEAQFAQVQAAQMPQQHPQDLYQTQPEVPSTGYNINNDNSFSVDPNNFNNFAHHSHNHNIDEGLPPPELNYPGVKQVVVDKFVIRDPLNPSGDIQVYSTTTVHPPLDDLTANNNHNHGHGSNVNVDLSSVLNQYNTHRNGPPATFSFSPTPPPPPGVLIRHHGAPSPAPPPQISAAVTTSSPTISVAPGNLLFSWIQKNSPTTRTTQQPQITSTTISPTLVAEDLEHAFQISKSPGYEISQYPNFGGGIGITTTEAPSIAGQIQDFLSEKMDFGAAVSPQMNFYDMLFNSRTGLAAPDSTHDKEQDQTQTISSFYHSNGTRIMVDEPEIQIFGGGGREVQLQDQITSASNLSEGKVEIETDTDGLANIFSLDYQHKYNRKPPELIILKVPVNHSHIDAFPQLIEKRLGEEIEIRGGSGSLKGSKYSRKDEVEEDEEEEGSEEEKSVNRTKKEEDDDRDIRRYSSEKSERERDRHSSGSKRKHRRKKGKRRRKKKRRNRNRKKERERERDDDDDDDENDREDFDRRSENKQKSLKISSKEKTNNANNDNNDRKQNQEAEQKFHSEIDWKSQLMANICELNPSSPLCLTYRSICLLMTSSTEQ